MGQDKTHCYNSLIPSSWLENFTSGARSPWTPAGDTAHTSGHHHTNELIIRKKLMGKPTIGQGRTGKDPKELDLIRAVPALVCSHLTGQREANSANYEL